VLALAKLALVPGQQTCRQIVQCAACLHPAWINYSKSQACSQELEGNEIQGFRKTLELESFVVAGKFVVVVVAVGFVVVVGFVVAAAGFVVVVVGFVVVAVGFVVAAGFVVIAGLVVEGFAARCFVAEKRRRPPYSTVESNYTALL
jgi:sterol desaturase/sphingolipid hydroxylase (fatty acid hydroxylase superfamily)